MLPNDLGYTSRGGEWFDSFPSRASQSCYDFLSVLCNCAVVDSIRLGPVVFAHRWRRIFDQLQG
jgi:hypothetical protein